MPKVEAHALNEVRMNTLARAIRSVMATMSTRRYQWIHGSQYLYYFVVLPTLPGSTFYKAVTR